MRTINGFFQTGFANPRWQFLGDDRSDTRSGLRIVFTLGGKFREKDALRFIQERFEQCGKTWLERKGTTWHIDLDGARHEFGDLVEDMDWLRGVAVVEPDVEQIEQTFFEQKRDETAVRFEVLEEQVLAREKLGAGAGRAVISGWKRA